jgi:hypothetical protein
MIDIVIDIDKHKMKIKNGFGILRSVIQSCGFCKLPYVYIRPNDNLHNVSL